MELSITKQQRGPVVKLVCSVMKCAKFCEEKLTAQMNAGDLASVILKFKSNAPDVVQLSIRVKKHDKAQKSCVIKVTCGEYNELILCSGEWIEAKIKDGMYSGYLKYPNGPTVYQYMFIVNISVHDILSTPSLSCNKLHTDTDFTDFELHSENGSVPVHKAMLFIHSNMFRTMLSGEWKETTEGRLRLNIDGVTMQTLQHLKDYMYLGTLPDEGLEQLLLIAARYLMDNLKSDCIAKLVKTIKPENFDGLVELACQNNIPELIRELFLQIPDDIVNGIQHLKKKQV